MWITLAWLALALIHTPPALAAFSPALCKRMYGVEEGGALGLILAHRGVLFLAVAAACVFAAIDAPARPLASIVAGISVLGFLAGYVLAGHPKRLRAIALTDAVGLIPLGAVIADAWF